MHASLAHKIVTVFNFFALNSISSKQSKNSGVTGNTAWLAVTEHFGYTHSLTALTVNDLSSWPDQVTTNFQFTTYFYSTTTSKQIHLNHRYTYMHRLILMFWCWPTQPYPVYILYMYCLWPVPLHAGLLYIYCYFYCLWVNHVSSQLSDCSHDRICNYFSFTGILVNHVLYNTA